MSSSHNFIKKPFKINIFEFFVSAKFEGRGCTFKNRSINFCPKQANKWIGDPRASIFELFIALLSWLNHFFVGLWSWSADKLHVHSQLWRLIFISRLSLKSNLPLMGLQHMQQCQVDWNIPLFLFAPGFWSKWMVPEKWSSQRGFEPTTTQSWVLCLNH